MDVYTAANAHVHLQKAAQHNPVNYSLGGRLQYSQSGWLVLTVPAALVRGAFDALHEQGAEPPPFLSIPVMSPTEIARIGGPDKITERGHTFQYTLGPVRSHDPSTDGLSRTWYIQILSPELKRLRHSYGLEPYTKGTHSFQLPIAVRKTGVLKPDDDVVKASEYLAEPDWNEYDLEAIEKVADIGSAAKAVGGFTSDMFSGANLRHMAGHGPYAVGPFSLGSQEPGAVPAALNFLTTTPFDYPLRKRGYKRTAAALNYGSKAVVGASLLASLVRGMADAKSGMGELGKGYAQAMGESDPKVLEQMRQSSSSPGRLARFGLYNILPKSLGGDPTPVSSALRTAAMDQAEPYVRGNLYWGVQRSPWFMKGIDVLRSLSPGGALVTAGLYGLADRQEPTPFHAVGKALKNDLNKTFDVAQSKNHKLFLEALNEARHKSGLPSHPATGVKHLQINPYEAADTVARVKDTPLYNELAPEQAKGVDLVRKVLSAGPESEQLERYSERDNWQAASEASKFFNPLASRLGERPVYTGSGQTWGDYQSRLDALRERRATPEDRAEFHKGINAHNVPYIVRDRAASREDEAFRGSASPVKALGVMALQALMGKKGSANEADPRRVEQAVKGLAEAAQLYHGSSVADIDTLEPRPSRVLGNESAVFGTPDKGLAISNIAKWRDEDFEQGRVNSDPWYMKERYPGAIDKILKGTSGHLYTLPKEGFSWDPRLMRSEAISREPVKPSNVEHIPDVYKALKDLGWQLQQHTGEVEGHEKAGSNDISRGQVYGALLSGLGASALGSYFLNKRLHQSLEEAPKAKGPYIRNLLRISGLDKETPITTEPGLNNAYWLDPGHEAKDAVKGTPHEELAKKLGLIKYDPTFARPGILAHEMGHGTIRMQNPWWAPSRINQSVLRPLSQIISMRTAPVAGTFAGLMSHNPLIGAGVGLGTGLATSLPTLINEWQASHRGKKYLDHLAGEHQQHIIEGNRKSLDKAFHTYLGAAAIPATVAGAVGGLLKMGQDVPQTYRFEGDVQGVGLRKVLHQILDQRRAEGLAYNDARKNQTLVTLNSNPKVREHVLRELRNYLDSREAKYTFQPVEGPPPAMKPVSMDESAMRKFVEGQGFTGMPPGDPRWRSWLRDRYRLKPTNAHLEGHVPELVAKQLAGEEPVYAYQLPGHPDYAQHSFTPKFAAQHIYHKVVGDAAKEVHGKPSDAQREAGNYRMGHIHVHGLPITIEVAKGQTRTKVNKEGKRWSRKMAHHYGYIKRTESAADGDHVDVYVGDHPESQLVFVVNQVKPGGKFDEHKCMLGFINKDEAKKGYLAHYPDNWTGLGSIVPATMDRFKEWLRGGDTGKEFTK